MTPWPHIPNGRGKIHVPLLLVALCGGIIIGGALMAVLWAIFRLLDWLSI